MSLQHDVKRYTIRCMEDEQHYGIEVESATGDYVAFTDYEAVRGEVKRLTAENEILKKLPRFNEQTHIARMVDAGCVVDFNGEDLYVQNVRAETAEASLRSLRDALVRSDSYLSLLRHRQEAHIQWGTIGIPERHEVDEVIGNSRKVLNLTPAAPDSTKSTESTAARKFNDGTTPTTDVARKEE
jgi:hypothetical protein